MRRRPGVAAGPQSRMGSVVRRASAASLCCPPRPPRRALLLRWRHQQRQPNLSEPSEPSSSPPGRAIMRRRVIPGRTTLLRECDGRVKPNRSEPSESSSSQSGRAIMRRRAIPGQTTLRRKGHGRVKPYLSEPSESSEPSRSSRSRPFVHAVRRKGASKQAPPEQRKKAAVRRWPCVSRTGRLSQGGARQLGPVPARSEPVAAPAGLAGFPLESARFFPGKIPRRHARSHSPAVVSRLPSLHESAPATTRARNPVGTLNRGAAPIRAAVAPGGIRVNLNRAPVRASRVSLP